MTDFVSNLINKFKKTPPQKDSTISIKSNSKNLVSEDSILLNEHLKVNIYSLKEVNIEKDGVVTGNIHSKSCIVNGRVNGNILSSEYIEVKNTAVIEGNIKSGSIQIEAGSMINGFISIEKKIKLPTIVPQPAASKVELEKLHTSAKPTLPNNEVQQIKTDPIVTQPSAPEILTEVPKIREKAPEVITELPKTKAEAPDNQSMIAEVTPQTNKTISETVKKDKIATENPPKKIDSPSSNDSWW